MAIKPTKVGIRAAFRLLCEDVGSPYARECSNAFLNGGMPALERVRQSFSPSAYHSVQTFAADYLVHCYISKLDIPSQGVDAREAECLADFLKVESRNAEWNRRLRSSLSLTAEGLIHSVRRKIRAVMGSPEKFRLAFLDHCDWGPGATYSLQSVDSTRDKKILEPRISITRRAIPYFLAYTQTDYHWFAARTGIMPDGPVVWLPCNFDVVRGERFSTAPKKWNKRRTISIQPTGNLFLQKGLGTFVRRRLKRFGIDLDDQSKNQELARFAQMLGFATLDLKDASNSMLREHIRLFFDEGWVTVMEDLRCPEVRLPDGSWHHLELHSAMGNGYTFEVESLIFWAIAQACCELSGSSQNSSVYGDDVIVPSSVAPQVVDALEGFGFQINTEKSFLSGRFYESCGKHYFDGIDVTPVYEKLEDFSLNRCIRSFNRLSRWCERTGIGCQRTLVFLELRAYQALFEYDEGRKRRLWRQRRMLRPRTFKPSSMPYQANWMEGDGGLITSDSSLLPLRCENGVWRVKVFSAQPISRETDGWSVYSDSLKRGVRETATYGLVSPRDQVKWGFRVQSFYDWARYESQALKEAIL